MQALRRSFLVRPLVVPITLLALLSGCYKWSSWDKPFPGWRELPSEVRLTLEDSRQLEAKNPVVTDTTISWSEGEFLWVIPVDEISRVEHRRFDWVATSLAVLLPVAGLTVVAIASCPGGNIAYGC